MTSSQRWIIVTLFIGLLLVFGLGAVLFLNRSTNTENALPTLIVFATALPTMEDTPLSNPTETATIAASATTSLNLEVTSTTTALQRPSTSTASSQTSEIPPTTVLTSVSAPIVTLPSNPIPSQTTVGIAPLPSETSPSASSPQAPSPTQQIVASATSLAPTATQDASGLIVFNQPVTVGQGALRVLSMTDPANEVILSLGDSIPSIPNNQKWILVELFMVCTGDSNCAPATSGFSLTTNANTYAPTTLNIESAFGTLFFSGQVLGHLAFVIPNNESPFALELTNAGQSYRFAVR